MGTDLCVLLAVSVYIHSQSTCKFWLFYCAVWWPARLVTFHQQRCSVLRVMTAPSSGRTDLVVTLPTRCRKDTLTLLYHRWLSTSLTLWPFHTKFQWRPTLLKPKWSTELFHTSLPTRAPTTLLTPLTVLCSCWLTLSIKAAPLSLLSTIEKKER